MEVCLVNTVASLRNGKGWQLMRPVRRPGSRYAWRYVYPCGCGRRLQH